MANLSDHEQKLIDNYLKENTVKVCPSTTLEDYYQELEPINLRYNEKEQLFHRLVDHYVTNYYVSGQNHD